MATNPTAFSGWRSPDQVRASENFPVALSILPRAVRRHLRALYRYARFVDDVGDEPAPGLTNADRLEILDGFEAEVRQLYSGSTVRHPVLRALAPTVIACRLPAGPLLRLIQANRIDQAVTRYATFEDLLEYCTYAAEPVGELVLHIFGQASPERVVRSNRICSALQIVEHLQDVAEDHRRGRVYLPKADMDRFGVAEDDLSRPTAGQPLRDLVGIEAERARALLESGAPLVATLHGWARLAVGGYLAGGRATLTALGRSGYDPLPAPPRARRRETATHWLAATTRSAG
jgi:squalene synthase HpnC